MKLQYKIASSSVFSILLALGTFYVVYSKSNKEEILKLTKEELYTNAKNASNNLTNSLKSKLDIVKTIGSSTELIRFLETSNTYYDKFDTKKQKEIIQTLNKQWIKERVGKSAFIKNYLENKISKYLSSQKKLIPKLYGEIFLTNKYGAMIATTGVLSTLAHAQKYWWKKSYNGGVGKYFFDDRGFDDSVSGYVLGIVTPIKKDGKIIGILKANININAILSGSFKHKINKNEKLKIVRSKGLVVFEKGKEPLSYKIEEKIIRSFSTSKINIADEKRIMIHLPIKFSKYNNMELGGKESSIDHIKGNKNETWHIVASIYKSVILNKTNKFNKIIFSIAILTILILTSISFVIGKYISKPIEELVRLFTLFGKGKHNIRSKVKSKDEIGILATAFNKMADNLQETMISRDKLIKETKLRKKAEERFSLAISSTQDGLWDWNLITNEVYFSPRWKSMLGYEDSELPNECDTWEARIHPDDFEHIMYEIMETQKKPNTLYEGIHRLKHKDGHWVWILNRGQTIFDENLKAIRMIGFHTDITHRKNLEDKLKEQQEIMISQSRHAAMGEMIGMIAHQWRQPLSIISMGANNVIADIQLETLNDESLLEIANGILEETQYLSKTIDDFRNFFRQDKDIELVDIKDICAETLKIIGKSLENSNIQIEKHFNTNKKIETYSRELLQVFINIIKNAKEALVEKRKENRMIKVTLEELEDRVIMHISDNAGGIDETIMDKIFNPYFSTKNENVGTGLGLYMSKTIIEKHLKGIIEVKNIEEGVQFEIILPFKMQKWDKKGYGELINE